MLAVLAVLCTAGTYLPVTLLAPLGPTSAVLAHYEAPPQVPATLAWPGYGASAIGAEGYDGVLASSGTDAPLPIASISKVITAMVVLEEKPLGDGDDGPSITLTQEDAALFGAYQRRNGSVKPSPAGLVLTERQMLQVMLISSANNYAESTARWAFGSTDAFVAAASEWLDAHGLSGTTLVEPTGMSPQNTSTSTDLVAIGKLALADPVVSEIVGTRSVTIDSVGRLDNSNDLLGIDGVDGIKTGTLDEAGACLLFSADYEIGDDTVTVVGVVLGGVDHDSLDVAIQSLLTSVENGFDEVTLVEQGQSFASFTTPWESTADAVAADDASMLVWSDTPVVTTVDVDEVTPASFGRPDDDIGSVTFSAGPRTVTVPLTLSAPITEPDAWWRLTHPVRG